jgi:malate dehydrogenase (oxaloacetate-decarboxylating)
VERTICEFRCFPVLGLQDLTPRFGTVSQSATVGYFPFVPFSLGLREIPDALIYPGLGFGAVLAKARSLSDSMILAGAQRLAALSPALKDPDNALLPDVADAPDVSFEVAVAVAEQAISEGIAGVEWNDQEVRERAKELQWLPIYGEYVYDEKGET